jgi:hypothetical protein
MSDDKRKNRVIESKERRQHTLDKLSIRHGQAYTYDTDEGSGCLHNARPAREKRQRKVDR